MTRIYLIRHAEAEGNLYRRIHGYYDSLVTENGKRQIEKLRERFRDLPVDAVYSSDLYRTCATARALTEPKGLKLHKDCRFREVYLGVWEDRAFGLINLKEQATLDLFNKDPKNWRVEGSETYLQYTDRFLAGLDEAVRANPGKTIAIFSHGTVIRGALMRLFFGPDGAAETGHSDNTAVTCLEYEDGQYRLVFKNDASHLPEEISTLARQSWWRKGNHVEDYNLWYRPVGEDKAMFTQCWADAWQGIYGSLDGLDADAFWNQARADAREFPWALVFAMQGENIAGLLQLEPRRGACSGAGYINFLYMLPQYRGRGMGIQLIGHAVAHYRPMGRTELELSCSEKNPRAMAFYRRHGFAPAGTWLTRQDKLQVLRKPIALPVY